MRKFLQPLVLTFGLMTSALAAEQVEAGRYLKAYSGGEGITVWVLRYGPQTNHEAIVQVVGIDHPLDGRIQKMGVEMTPRGLTYVVGKDGNRQNFLQVDEHGIELTMHGVRPTRLAYDKTLSAQGNRAMFLTEFTEQK